MAVIFPKVNRQDLEYNPNKSLLILIPLYHSEAVDSAAANCDPDDHFESRAISYLVLSACN